MLLFVNFLFKGWPLKYQGDIMATKDTIQKIILE